MRVCHITPAYPDDAHGYREGQNYRCLCEHLVRQDTACEVVTARQYRDSPEHSTERGIAITRFVFGDVDARLGETRLGPFTAWRYVMSGIRAIRNAHANAPFDVLHAHMPVPCGLVAVLAGRKIGVPVVLSTHGSDLLLYPRRSGLIRFFTGWVLKRCAAVTAVSEELRRAAQEMVGGLDVAVIPIGYDGRVFTPGVAAEQRERTVVSTRNLAPLYRVATLVEAVSTLDAPSQVRTVVYGDGPDRQRLESLAADADIEFRGFASAPGIAAQLQRSAIYVTTAESDGTSVSLLEALATGAYPIATDIPANREWIGHEDEGALFPVGDAKALAAAIEAALNDAPRRDRAALTNPGRVAGASWEAVIPEYLSLYRKVLG